MTTQTKLITNRSGVYQYSTFSQFPSVGFARFLYIDTSNANCYRWNSTVSRYDLVSANIRTWANGTTYRVGEIVIADYALFICEAAHTSVTTGTIYSEVGKWRNASNSGRVDVTSVTGSATITIGEMNASEFNIFVQPDNATSNLVITLPNPTQRTGQILTYTFSAVPAVTNNATVSFNNLDGTAYTYTPSFKIPNASTTHQGIRCIRFVSTALGNGDSSGMWFPLGEDFRGSTQVLPGSSGSVPAPAVADINKFLSGSGVWNFAYALVPSWNANTNYPAGRIFSTNGSLFIVTTDTTSGGVSVVDDLTNGKPYRWVGGHEYIYALPVTPSTITVDVPTFRIVSGTTSGTFTLPTATGSGRRIRIIREDPSSSVITITDPTTALIYPVQYTAVSEVSLVLVDGSVAGWVVDGYGAANPKIISNVPLTTTQTIGTHLKNVTHRVSTSSGAITLTLPTVGMTIGDYFEFIDSTGNWGTNNLTISGLLYGSVDSYVIDLPKRKITFVYIDNTTGFIME